MLSYIIWNFNPDLFTIPGLDYAPRWYGVLFASGLMLGYLIMSWMRAREAENSKYAKNLDLDVLLIVLVVGTVVGARLYHVFFYQWSYYQEHILEIFLVWKGGLASHGGAIGIILLLWSVIRVLGNIGCISGVKPSVPRNTRHLNDGFMLDDIKFYTEGLQSYLREGLHFQIL